MRSMMMLVGAVVLAGCGVQANGEGHIRIPIGLGCEAYFADLPSGAEVPEGGPQPKDARSYSGAECVVIRW